MSSPAIAVTPASPRATIDFCRVDVTHVPENDRTAYDAAEYPTSPEVRYVLVFEVGGKEVGRSYVFAAGQGQDGAHEFNNYVFPVAGDYTVRLKNVDTDADLTTQSVTVS